jgi:hypothetical protein
MAERLSGTIEEAGAIMTLAGTEQWVIEIRGSNGELVRATSGKQYLSDPTTKELLNQASTLINKQGMLTYTVSPSGYSNIKSLRLIEGGDGGPQAPVVAAKPDITLAAATHKDDLIVDQVLFKAAMNLQQAHLAKVIYETGSHDKVVAEALEETVDAVLETWAKIRARHEPKAQSDD